MNTVKVRAYNEENVTLYLEDEYSGMRDEDLIDYFEMLMKGEEQ